MLNILIADEQIVSIKGLEKILIENFTEVNIFFSTTFNETTKILNSQRIDILIYDIDILFSNSKKIVDEIRKISPHLKILIFSNYSEKIHAIRFIHAGANGFLQKNASEKSIIKAVLNISKIGVYVSPEMEKSIYEFAKKRKVYNPLESLSQREMEVAKLLIQGFGNIEIINKLDIKSSTISTYKNRIYQKLEINNSISLAEIFNVYGEFN